MKPSMNRLILIALAIAVAAVLGYVWISHGRIANQRGHAASPLRGEQHAEFPKVRPGEPQPLVDNAAKYAVSAPTPTAPILAADVRLLATSPSRPVQVKGGDRACLVLDVPVEWKVHRVEVNPDVADTAGGQPEGIESTNRFIVTFRQVFTGAGVIRMCRNDNQGDFLIHFEVIK